MVTHRNSMRACVAMLALLCGIAWAASTEKPRHAMAPIKTVAIIESGRSEHADDYAVGLCKHFEPTTTQVRTFIEQAREVNSRVHTHERYSPCYASGTVEFEDGTTGTWRIHSGRTGILRVDPQPALTLQCRRCRWTDPFAGGYTSR